MRILVTNDDGYQSDGLTALIDALEGAGHQVWVCAPFEERSASSHSMTFHKEIVITEYAQNRFYCSGTPADCILYATKGKILPGSPDLVISGINYGYNISTDILYSGTVGAAREAALHGLKALAVSCSRGDDGTYPFDRAAAFVVEHLDDFYPLASKECLININIPANGNGKWRSAVPAILDYHGALETRSEGASRHFDAEGGSFGNATILSLIGGGKPSQRCLTERSDFSVVDEGYVSVTALSLLPPVHADVQRHLDALSKEAWSE
jgi:5'-nucleotidase